MRSLSLAAALTSLVLLAAVAVPQTRAKKPEAKDMPEMLAKVGELWAAADYPGCMRELKSCTALANARWTAAIREALPAAPEGWTKVAPKEESQMQAGAMAALAVGVGTVVEQQYTADGKRLTATVTADSPMIGMMSMMFTNPAMLGPDKELVEYGTDKAILDTSNANRLNLQILISGKHLVDVQCPENDEFLFAMFDQAAIDRLSRVLGA